MHIINSTSFIRISLHMNKMQPIFSLFITSCCRIKPEQKGPKLLSRMQTKRPKGRDKETTRLLGSESHHVSARERRLLGEKLELARRITHLCRSPQQRITAPPAFKPCQQKTFSCKLEGGKKDTKNFIRSISFSCARREDVFHRAQTH